MTIVCCFGEPWLEEQSGRNRENRLPVSTLASEDCTSYEPRDETRVFRELSSFSTTDRIITYDS